MAIGPRRCEHCGGTMALLGLLLAGLLPWLGGCDRGSETAAAPAPPPTVTVTPVVRRAIMTSTECVGRVVAIEDVDLHARVQGFLLERRFVEGGMVRAGDVLFVIDPAQFQADVDFARANLASAEAAVPETQRALERAQQLLSHGNISQASVDEAVADAAQARATVQARQADLRQKELNLGYTQITSPINGRIGRAAYSVGNLIGPDSGVLANITALDPIYVTCPISEREFVDRRQEQIARGLPPHLSSVTVRLRLPNKTDYPYPGYHDFVDNRVDPRTGTITVRAVFPNPEQVLLPGQYVTAIASGSEPAQALLVPQAAVQEDQGGRFVLTVEASNEVKMRRVATGAQRGADWVIESGVREGEMVVVQGLQRIRPGVAVRPVVENVAAAGG